MSDSEPNNLNDSPSLSSRLQTLYLSIILSFFTIISGTLGYLWLLSPDVSVLDALYMTIITLSTVGYAEIIDLSGHPWVRIFTMGLIIFGAGNLLFLFSSITAYLTDNEFNQNLKRRRLMKTIARYQNHLIICGLGNVGARVVRELIKFNVHKKSTGSKTPTSIVVIDTKPEVLEKFKAEHLRTSKLSILTGDATEESILQQAGIDKASQVVASLSDDRDNVLLTVTVKKQNPHTRVIAKINNISSHGKLIAAGADAVISPQYIGALSIVSQIMNPHSQDVVERIFTHGRSISTVQSREATSNHYHWQEIHLPNNAGTGHWLGKSVADLGISENFHVPIIAIKNGDEINYRPKPNTILKEDDVLVLIASDEEVQNIRQHTGL